MDKICSICNNHSQFKFRKEASNYFQCTNCKMLFCDPIDQDGMVGGDAEIPRNKEQNHLRIDRINDITKGSAKEDVYVLDFGAGTGYLVSDLKGSGYINTTAYDAYNPEFSRLPEKNKYHIVTMIEVAEHISHPFVEFDLINRSMVPRGILIIETSFINVAEQEGIPLSEFHYVSPKHGHSTIHSWHSLDLLMMLKGFIPLGHHNRHVRYFMKSKK